MRTRRSRPRDAESRFLFQRGQNREAHLYKGLEDMPCPKPRHVGHCPLSGPHFLLDMAKGP